MSESEYYRCGIKRCVHLNRKHRLKELEQQWEKLPALGSKKARTKQAMQYRYDIWFQIKEARKHIQYDEKLIRQGNQEPEQIT